MARTNVLHGARIKLKIGGKLVALTTNVAINEIYAHQPVDPLGQVQVEEHILVSYTVDGSGERFRAYNKTLVALGIEPKKTSIQDLLNHPEATFELEDTETPGTVERLIGFRLTEKNRGYQKGQLTMEQFRFVAIKATDESEN